MEFSGSQFKTWARIGAAQRLVQLESERSAILKAFPQLRSWKVATAEAGRRRRVFSDAARKRMAAGMRRYWAKRKAKEGSAK